MVRKRFVPFLLAIALVRPWFGGQRRFLVEQVVDAGPQGDVIRDIPERGYIQVVVRVYVFLEVGVGPVDLADVAPESARQRKNDYARSSSPQ